MMHCGYVAAYVVMPQCVQCEDVSQTLTHILKTVLKRFNTF